MRVWKLLSEDEECEYLKKREWTPLKEAMPVGEKLKLTGKLFLFIILMIKKVGSEMLSCIRYSNLVKNLVLMIGNVTSSIHTKNANVTWSYGNTDKMKVFIIVVMFLLQDGELTADHMQLARVKVFPEWFLLLRIIQNVVCA